MESFTRSAASVAFGVPLRACEAAGAFPGQSAKPWNGLGGPRRSGAGRHGWHSSGPLSSRAPGAQREAGTARTRPGSRAGLGALGQGRREERERSARLSSARLPSLGKIALQMGRSCALTGLNWKRSKPVNLEAGE